MPSRTKWIKLICFKTKINLNTKSERHENRELRVRAASEVTDCMSIESADLSAKEIDDSANEKRGQRNITNIKRSRWWPWFLGVSQPIEKRKNQKLIHDPATGRRNRQKLADFPGASSGAQDVRWPSTKSKEGANELYHWKKRNVKDIDAQDKSSEASAWWNSWQ